MNAWELRGLLQELIDENPFAIRAVLKILRVEFTDEVPTLAVTAEAHPRLKINPAFVAQHCRTPEQVKAVLCHEFLHVLLRHTSLKGPLTPARHLALDAVINAIIHRQLGVAYSSLMSEYYAKKRGLGALLRPMTDTEKYRYVMTPHGGGRKPPTWWHTWNGLYQGTVLADDLEQLAEELACPPSGRSTPIPGPGALLGNHADEAAGNGSGHRRSRQLPLRQLAE